MMKLSEYFEKTKGRGFLLLQIQKEKWEQLSTEDPISLMKKP